MDIAHRNEEFSNTNNPKIYLPDSSLRNLNGSSMQPHSLSTLENQNYQHFASYQTNRISSKKDAAPNFSKSTSQESDNQFDIALGSNANDRFSKALSASLVAHKVIDLRNTNRESNFYTNNSIDSLNKSSYNTEMYFGTENSSVVATQTGATAHISCVVHHIGDCVVSWIRKKDYHLLTVGLTAYSSDERFSATHLKHSEDWTLQIKFVQERDSGIYECQVSTYPPKSIFVHLLVVEARAEISGPNVRYLTPGSTLRLQCHVVQNTESSEFIFWYHDNRMINYDMDRGINVSTESDFQSSELLISRTRREHSGNYTCVASNTQSASVLIHIFKGDNPAAMYHGDVGSSTKSYQTQLLHILITVATKVYGSIVNRI